MRISVVVATCNRPKLILQALNSIFSNNFINYEIIVIDQTNHNNKNKKIIQSWTGKTVRYFKMRNKSKTKALNFALQKTKGKIIAFTDDDCLVDKDWLKNIHQSFQENKDITGAFGKVLPYKPQSNKRKVCPCTFLSNKKKIINKTCLHFRNIGFGNNMAFKREIFEKTGGFKKWLGPGSIGLAGEDAEFALRALLKGYKILYNPKIKVYHNRWLSKEEFRKQSLSYSCGEVACYGYFFFQGKKFAKKVVINNFKDSYWKLRRTIKQVLFLKKNSLRLLSHTSQELYFRLRGLIVAFYFSKKEPLRLKK